MIESTFIAAATGVRRAASFTRKSAKLITDRGAPETAMDMARVWFVLKNAVLSFVLFRRCERCRSGECGGVDAGVAGEYRLAVYLFPEQQPLGWSA
jgi:hypothetical protein